MTEVHLHEALARGLAEHGVGTIFGVLGDGNLFVVEAFVREQGGRYVPTSNESGAVLAAQGYGMAADEVGVATVTHGPALTNTITALVEGARDRTPMLLLCGDTAAGDRDNLQNLPHRELVGSTGAGFEDVTSAAGGLEALGRAMRRARVERRPIVLNVGVDHQWEKVTYEAPQPDAGAQAIQPDPEALDRAVGIIATARRPVVLAGAGAVRSGARSEALVLAGLLGAPVATTLRAKDLFSGEPGDLGVFGTLAEAGSSEVILESDCIVALGASLNRYTTSSGAFTRGKRVVHCDSDPTQLGAQLSPTCAVVGDARATASALAAWLREAGREPPAHGWADGRTSPRQGPRDCSAGSAGIDIHSALAEIDRIVPADRTLVTDGGRFVGATIAELRVDDPRKLIYTFRGCASIGLGMGTAIGAAIARPGAPTLLVTGDGGFMLGGLAELSTAVRAGTDLMVVVCNDGSYGPEHVRLLSRGLDPSLAWFRWPDFAPVAEALGARGLTVRTPHDLAGVAEAVAGRDRPILIDLKLDPDAIPSVGH